jgi:hypothetical protein
VNMKTTLAALGLAGAALFGAGQASAMPMSAAPGALAASAIETVRFGCGPGWHPNPWGRCVPNARAYYYGRPMVRPYVARPRYYVRPYGPRW